MVKEFHKVFNVEDHNTPLTKEELEYKKDMVRLRANLIVEEFKEVMEAIGAELFSTPIYGRTINSVVSVEAAAKKLCDLLYVVYGTAASFGIPIDECFAEVHKSNMSKLDKDGNPIYREGDGKVMKSDQYKPADIKKVLENAN